MFYLGPTLLLIVLRHFLIPCWNISIDYRALCINAHLYYRSASKIPHILSFHPAQHNGPSWILINFCNATQLNNLTCQHNFTQLNLWFLKSELTSRNVHPCHLESVEVRRHLEPPAVRHQSMLKLENWIDSVHKWLQLNCNHHICDLTHVVKCLRSYKEGNWVGLIVQNLQDIDHQSWLFCSCIATTTSFKNIWNCPTCSAKAFALM